MIKVNFRSLNVEQRIGEFVDMNLCEDIGNCIYQQARTIEMDSLARRIHGSTEAIELTDNEAELVVDAISRYFTLPVISAVKRAIEDGTE